MYMYYEKLIKNYKTKKKKTKNTTTKQKLSDKSLVEMLKFNIKSCKFNKNLPLYH